MQYKSYPKWNLFFLWDKAGESLFPKTDLKEMADFAYQNFLTKNRIRSCALWDKAADCAPQDGNR